MTVNAWRIVTWNIRGSATPDLAAIATVIEGYSADAIAVQEVRRGQAVRLASLLGWNHCWARKHYPWSPLLWWLAEGLAIISPHPLSAVEHHSISPGVSWWTHRHRIVLAADLDRVGNQLRVYATHLASGCHPDERIAQARRVATLVATETPRLAVVAGDLNAPGEPEVIREFHAVDLCDPGGGATHPSIAPRRRLDYLLVPSHCRVTEQTEPEGGESWWELSDHLPVLVEFVATDHRPTPADGSSSSHVAPTARV